MYKSYFNKQEAKKYNAITNLFLSDRSDGKTFNIKCDGFINYKLGKYQYVYLRRWKTEIPQSMYETFYDEVVEKVLSGEFVGNPIVKDILNYEFMGTKQAYYIREKGTDKWDILCYFMPLTMTGKKKSTLSIKRILSIEYDEFMPVDGRYASKEMDLLMEFYKSVDRDRDSTILNIYGNRIDNFNPFFDYFDIHLGIQKEKIRTYKNGTVLVQIYTNNEHREEREKTRFADMVKGTSYEEYSKGGTLFSKIVKIGNTKGCWYFASFKSCLGQGSIWISERQLVISSQLRKDGDLIVDKIYNTGREEYLITYGNLPQLFKQKAQRGLIYYDKENTYHIFEPLLNKIGGMK